ncbi:hypothetical protein [Candidatus Poriferisodalis sp.]|uniref:hypothetical protein n=1 Tax=Candidatus Poriferisodalis sp. TaxID=3101277 RepID=UPI003B525752
MSLVLDSGALISLERNDLATWERLSIAHRTGRPPITHGGVIAQVWRGGTGRQTRLARALRGIRTEPLDDALGRRAGVLLARSGLADAIDAALVALCDHDDEILTSDPDDIAVLVDAAGLRVDILSV